MNPDRVAVGDLLVLEGRYFLAGEPLVVVQFGSIPVTVAPESGSRLSVLVPPGAATGPVTVTTHAIVDGRLFEQTSPPAHILVSWKRVDVESKLAGQAAIQRLLPGSGDDVEFLALKTIYWGSRYELRRYRVNALGGVAFVSGRLYICDNTDWSDLSVSAKNPATDEAFYLYVRRPGPAVYTPMTFEIRNLTQGTTCIAFRWDSCPAQSPYNGNDSEDYLPVAFGFDASGGLLVVGARWGLWHVESVDGTGIYRVDRPVEVNFWRFPAPVQPGPEPVRLRIESALSPVSFGVATINAVSWSFDASVAPDGAALVRFRDYPGIGDPWSSHLWAVPPLGSPLGPVEVPVPFFETFDGHSATRNAGTLASDCMGRFFVMENRWHEMHVYDTGPVWIVERDGAGLPTLIRPWAPAPRQGWPGCPAGEYYPLAIATDAYGNVYEWAHDFANFNEVLHRFTPCELLEPDFYDAFDCCAVTGHAALLQGQGRPPGVRIPPDVCEAGGTLRIKRTPEPEDPISGWEGNPDAFTWIEGDGQGKAEAQALFGQAPKLQAFWKPAGGGEETAETVKWEIVANSETAPNADPKGLYPGKPAVFFTGGVTPYEHAELRFQTVHTGSFILRATTKDTHHKGPDGQPAKIEIAFTVAAPAGLKDYSDTHHEFDALIIQYADKYGIPPQYIKSQAHEESGHEYAPGAFRYEPLGFDKKYISTWSASDWAENNYDYFKFPGGSGLTDGDMRLRENFSHIVYYDFTVQPPVLPYECQHYDGGDPDVLLYDVVIANDGWPRGSYAWALFNHARGPCGATPQNWSGDAGGQLAWHDETFYCGATATSPCSAGQRRLIQWLFNHWEYPAQTAVASSYGLMQLMYPTAVGPMRWRRGQPPLSRNPVLLFDPAISLDLGTGYDARNTIRR
ncbi:MAG: hypothetical protein AB1347_09795, partial [Acidobacteriota bacterium]